MNKKIKRIIKIGVIITVLFTLTTGSVSACTGFTSSDDETVLVGSNYDGGNFDINLRFFPAEEGKYGMMFFETWATIDDGTTGMAPMAGINDQGAWYDTYGTPYLLPVNSSDKPQFSDSNCYYRLWSIGEYGLATCTTIDEMMDILLDYNMALMTTFQLFIVDATGNSVIFEGDDYFYKEGDFQVVSNFLLSHPELGGGAKAFERYETAVSMLENMTDLSVDYFTSICNATHTGGTVFSWICDLKNQMIYLYYLQDYENMVVIDLKEELKKGEHSIYLGSLFEPEENHPPTKPDIPTGPESGNISTEYTYKCRKTTDPDGDRTLYLFDWGDGTTSNWISPPTLGTQVSGQHNYSERGTYEIKVKARDFYGRESEWSDPLIVSMPKNKAPDPVGGPWFIRGTFKYLDEDEDYIYVRAFHATIWGIGVRYRLLFPQIKISKPFYGFLYKGFLPLPGIGICREWGYVET